MIYLYVNSLRADIILYVVLHNVPLSEDESPSLGHFLDGINKLYEPQIVPTVKVLVSTQHAENIQYFPEAEVVVGLSTPTTTTKKQNTHTKAAAPRSSREQAQLARQKDNRKLKMQLQKDRRRNASSIYG